ncbi:hypothetical protein Pla8534_44250 [Lignipirellula cremea]|uniref:Uncharacterized protein n=1 Tax=Lignipirellula cremea TaxID=2528010 RepID=A0A518DXQ0_9BACT|nr:hypothetical protein Pla8534_44250 [Lignipirellula cremea]
MIDSQCALHNLRPGRMALKTVLDQHRTNLRFKKCELLLSEFARFIGFGP